MYAIRISISRVLSCVGLITVACVAFLFFDVSFSFAAVPAAPVIGPAWYGKNGATVNFSAPVSDGGKTITGYTVTSSPEGKVGTGSCSPIIVSGLTYGVPNTFTVTATNGDGTSAPSVPSGNVAARPFAPATGTINNLVVFIRFSDQPAFTQLFSYYDGLFNSDTKSLKNFYIESSYSTLTVTSFFPLPALSSRSTDGFSYKDLHPTSYYAPYNVSTNPTGYQTALEGTQREIELVTNALAAIKDQIPGGLDLDGDNDGFIDHITFEVYSSQLYPQPVKFYSRAAFDSSGSIVINGKQVGSYTWVAASQDSPEFYLASVEIHEMGHSFGYPDLRGNAGRTPVGDWDVMSMSKPVHSGAYMKNKFTGWVASIPEITSYGTYSINDLTQSTNNSYKISIPGRNEFLVLEYRKAAGAFESNLPGSGLCITRVNEAAGISGNLGGPPFFLYYFRPGGTLVSEASNTNAFTCLSAETGQTQFNDYSNPACFLSDGSPCGISIYNIGSASGSSVTFSVGNPATTTVTHVIRGNVTYGSTTNRVIGATVTLSGDALGEATTALGGGTTAYLFTVNAGGSYTVTPTMANVIFNPVSATVSPITLDQVLNFSATKITKTISGTITSAGLPMGGVPVIFNCPAGGNYVGQMTTDVTGAYSFVVDAGSTCSVWPSKLNYNFSPNSKSFSNITSNQSQDFATISSSVTLTGTIKNNGNPVSGITVSCPGASSSTPVITDNSGSYSFTVMIGNGSGYTVTPSSPMYAFSPIQKTYSALVGGQVQNFTVINNPALTIDFIGTGGGVVTDGGGYSCNGNPCPLTYYLTGTPVALFAFADTNSQFTGWSVNCGTGEDCGLVMDAAKTVSAAFDRLKRVALPGAPPTFFGLLMNAYKAAAGGDHIQSQAQVFNENLLFDAPINITIDGGYDDSTFVSNTGFTFVQGSMKISKGKVMVRNVILK